MILLIDAGNTRIKLDWINAHQTRRASADQAFTLDELNRAQQWLQGLPQRPSRALGVNVAGPRVAAAIESMVGCPIEWVQAAPQALGVRNGYQEPGRLGADRWAAMVGLAWHERQRCQTASSPEACALLAIFGTATTIDTLQPASKPASPGDNTAEGVFVFPGGLILPGPAMMLSSLSAGTANLPHAQGQAALYPVHTHEAIVTGVAAAQAGAVLRQWLAAQSRYDQAPEVYVSGGGWPLISDEVQRLLAQACHALGMAARPVRVLQAPVLDGLACLARARLN